MNFKRVRRYTIPALICIFGLASQAGGAMQSSNYKIPDDSLNIGGGYSASSNYKIEDTAGEEASGPSNSTNYAIKAGYQQMNEVYISITSGSPITLPSINGLTGGTSDGSGSWTVTTDSTAGYSLYIRAVTSPALQGLTDSFADYVPAGSDPDYLFAIGADASEFGFSPEGTDILQKFKDNGAACNAGSFDTPEACWDGLSTTDAMIAQGAASNHPAGTETTVRFRAQSGSSHIQPSDTYSASVVVTAISL